MKPTYRAPLAIHFENLSIYIKQKIAPLRGDTDSSTSSVIKGDNRVRKLRNAYDKLQLWASMLYFRHPSQDKIESLVGDVLEAIDASEPALSEQLHSKFSQIAIHVSNDDSKGWDENIDDLDDLIPRIREKYANLQQEKISAPPRQSIVLCLDGGGVASFSSLLIVQALMWRVTEVIKESAAEDDKLSLLCTTRPRNFFDYVFGSSSGGMIAIMIGRLHMTIDECIESFKSYGDDVFPHARSIPILQFLFLDRPKYGEKPISKAIKKVVERYRPESEKHMWKQHTFAASRDQCRTAVMADLATGKLGRPHLFRTYDHVCLDRPASPKQDIVDADSAPIWEVAKATSALPYYFKYATVQGKQYRDGGFVFNNPSFEAFSEITHIHRWHQKHSEELPEHQTKRQNKYYAEKDLSSSGIPAVFVSIGSGKQPLPGPRAFKAIPGLKTLEEIYQLVNRGRWSNTEMAHERVELLTRHTNTAYYRFNAGEGIGNMKIDEWVKTNSEGKRVNKTLALIEQETATYLKEAETKKCIQACAEKLVQLRRKQL